MLSRFLSSSSTRPLLIRSLTLVFTSSSPISPPPLPLPRLPRPSAASFSSKGSSDGGGDDDGKWKLTPETDDTAGSLFDDPEEGDIAGLVEEEEVRSGSIPTDGTEWEAGAAAEEEKKGDIFEDIDRDLKAEDKGRPNELEAAHGFKPWGFGEDKEEEREDLFGISDEEISGDFDASHEVDVENEKAEEVATLKLQEKQLRAVVKGPDRSFGDLITESGITDEMLDSLLLLKDVSGVQGLPNYREIEDMYINATDDTSRFEEEQKKQQAIEEARVKKVDEKGRAYGTGKRKCSVARVFIQPGDGNFTVNDKQFDNYFPCLHDRAHLLSPFNVTDTLGQWDVYCTVKGGGISGQVGAIRLGISRALQNFEPGFRQYLKPAGFLTRDARIVERKKPGKAKARKSFQWSKR